MKHHLLPTLFLFIFTVAPSVSVLAQKKISAKSAESSPGKTTATVPAQEKASARRDMLKPVVAEDLVLEMQIKQLFITAWHQHGMMNKSTLLEQSAMDSVFATFNTSLVQLVIQRETELHEHITELKNANEGLYHRLVEVQNKEASEAKRAATEKAQKEELVLENDKLRKEAADVRKKLEKH